MWTITYETTQLVSRYRGTLPVLITCPHDGTANPGVAERTGQPSCPPFSKQRDRHTRLISEGVAQKVLELTGEAPYVVIAEFHRKYIDANRAAQPLNCAFDDPAAQPFYDEYHGCVRAFVDEIRSEHGGLGLLFDLHGTKGVATNPADVYFGTDDGRTIARLLQVDHQAMWRRRSLRSFLQAASYTIVPRELGTPEEPTLNGGFTVRAYGSNHPDGLDAIQLEFDNSLRDSDSSRDLLINVLAFAITSLATLYADVHTLAAFRSLNTIPS